MSESFFDDLARTLAQPMPRRRAVRVLGAALVTAVLPGVSARAAFAGRMLSTCEPNTRECKCPSAGGRFFVACCPTNHPTLKYTCECFGEPDPRAQCTAQRICPPGSTKCGNDCCEPYENCVGGRCECNERCGSKCCEEGASCASEARSLCCPKKWKVCVAGTAGAVKCCPPRETCCMKFGRASAQCCGEEQTCDTGTGTCQCKKGKVACGTECCDPAKETCAQGKSSQGKPIKKCCPKGKTMCGGACCGTDRCCKTENGDVCCPKDATCVRNRDGRGKTCCPRSRLIDLAELSLCCPPGTRTAQAVNCVRT